MLVILNKYIKHSPVKEAMKSSKITWEVAVVMFTLHIYKSGKSNDKYDLIQR